MSKKTILLLILTQTLLLTACGQSGPLYLPQPELSGDVRNDSSTR